MYIDFMKAYLVLGFILVLFSLLVSICGLYLMVKESVYLVEYFLFKLGGVEFKYEMVFDWVSCLYMGVVLFISGMVLIYSEDYMQYDTNKDRFLLLVSLFILSMVLMISSGGLISVLLGWDGLGLISYCLVIYYNSGGSYKAGMITIVSNRVGDVLLLVSIGSSVSMGSWNFSVLSYESKLESYVSGMIVLAACTKSAQFPFSAWLPEASAAPTPVSSLVHSSTLVTAGVFLLVRFNYLFDNGNFLFLLSLLTMLMAGWGALTESDMKKVVAKSTLSQLGLMMFSLSVGLWKIAYFHSIMHAFFKALMFMCVGSLIYGSGGNQDFRLVNKKLKGSWIVIYGFMVSVMCLMGAPFLCGYFSKDSLLEVYLMSEKNLLGLFLFSVGFFVSVFYGSRLFFMATVGLNLVGSYMAFMEKQWMNVSILMMSLASVFVGGLMSWGFCLDDTVLLSSFLKSGGVILVVLFLWGLYGSSEGMEWGWDRGLFFLKGYLKDLWFLGIVTGAIWKSILLEFKSLDWIVEQQWIEELSVWLVNLGLKWMLFLSEFGLKGGYPPLTLFMLIVLSIIGFIG